MTNDERAELTELRDALAGLQARVEQLEQAPAAGDRRDGTLDGHRASSAPAAPTLSDDDPFWVLTGLKGRVDPPGGIVFAGAVAVAAGPVEWQIGATTEGVLEADWALVAPSLAALGNATRLGVLQAVVGGADTVAEISSAGGLGSTGQLYHHLGQLVATGWLVAGGRGRYSVPVERVVPLMVVLAAARRTP